MAHDVASLQHQLVALGQGSQPPRWDDLGSLDVPVMLLSGEADPKYDEIAEAMFAAIPDCLRFTLPGGHALPLEQPEAVAAALRARGIDGSRIDTRGYGEAFPVASNTSTSEKSINAGATICSATSQRWQSGLPMSVRGVTPPILGGRDRGQDSTSYPEAIHSPVPPSTFVASWPRAVRASTTRAERPPAWQITSNAPSGSWSRFSPSVDIGRFTAPAVDDLSARQHVDTIFHVQHSAAS